MSYVATVQGKYYVTEGRDRISYKPYKLRFRLNSADKPLSDIVKYLLDPALKKRYSDAEGFVTHNLVGIYNEDDPQDVLGIPLIFMSHDQLERYCKLRQITYVEIDKNVDVGIVRVEVQTAVDSGRSTYEELVAKRHESAKREAEVLAGGELLDDDEDAPEVPKKAPKKKASKKKAKKEEAPSVGEPVDEEADEGFEL